MSTKYTVVRLIQGGEKFEILADPDLALTYQEEKKGDVSKILVVDAVFTDARKGTRASAEKMESSFGTSDTMKVATIILERGRLQLTAEQRQRMIEQKKRRIIYLIARNYVDPRTKLPHPPMRIEQAMEQVHLPIDPYKDAEEQIQTFVNALRPLLPLSVEHVSLAIKIPAEHVAKAYGTVKNLAEIKREEWQSDGSWIAVVELPAGLRGEFLDRLGKITGGAAQAKIIS
ncbi:MAG: ribosome assembly factor SBDS [Candidatus Bathyarchaeia archaeon]